MRILGRWPVGDACGRLTGATAHPWPRWYVL